MDEAFEKVWEQFKDVDSLQLFVDLLATDEAARKSITISLREILHTAFHAGWVAGRTDLLSVVWEEGTDA